MPQDDRIALLAAKLKSMDVDQLKGIAAGYGVEESELHFSESDLLDSGSSIDQSLSMTTLSSSSPVRTRNDRLMQSSQLISRLQAQVEAKSREVDVLNEKCTATQVSLNGAIARAEGLRQDVLALNAQKSDMLQHYQAREQQLLQAKAKIQADLEVIATAQENAERRMADYKANVRAKLGDQLLITDEAHASLATIRESDLDLLQFVRLKVYEEVHSWKQTAEEKTAALEVLTEHADYTADTLKRTQTQLEHLQKVHSEEMDHLRTSLERYEKKNEYLTGELEELSRRYDSVKAKEMAYDRTLERAETLERTCTRLEAENDMQKQKLEFLNQERNEYRAESVNDKHGMQNASNELKFVTRENEYLLGRIKELEAEKARWDEKVRDLKKAKQEAVDRLYQERESMAAQHEAKLLKETDRLRADNQRDLDCIREQCREVSEQETRTLREARDAAISESERLRRKAKDAKEEKEQVLNEFKELQDCSATTIAELRGTLKTREFELDRARMVAEECRANTLHLRTEHEIAVKKLEVLRNDFYDTQMQYNTRVAELQGQIDTYREKVSIYNSLETETDDLICKFAQSTAGTEGNAEAVLEQATSSIACIPTAPARRIQQAIALARQATQLQAQVLQLREELEAKTKSETAAQVELGKLRSLVDVAGQPYGYFIGMVQDKDQEIVQLKTAQAALQASHDELLAENDALHEDLERLVSQKQEVLRMKELLMQLREGMAPPGLPSQPEARPHSPLATPAYPLRDSPGLDQASAPVAPPLTADQLVMYSTKRSVVPPKEGHLVLHEPSNAPAASRPQHSSLRPEPTHNVAHSDPPLQEGLVFASESAPEVLTFHGSGAAPEHSRWRTD